MLEHIDPSTFNGVLDHLSKMKDKDNLDVGELDQVEQELLDAVHDPKSTGVYKYEAYNQMMDALEDIRHAHTHEKESLSGDATAKIDDAFKSMSDAVTDLKSDKPKVDHTEWDDDGNSIGDPLGMPASTKDPVHDPADAHDPYDDGGSLP